MQVNFKEGFRRIILILICIATIISIAVYINNDFILNQSSFVRNIYVVMPQDKKITLNEYRILKYKDYFNKNSLFSDILMPTEKENPHFKCYPNKRYCKSKLFDKEVVFEEGLEPNGAKILMPSPLWSVFDFLIIFFYAGLAYLLYLLFEKIIIWIFSGFKK